ncbi:putative membrane protein SpoIIM required for sporulation [Bacillus pakistanensis]|uniref:Membrane protein SpoIIM required for sporulation n=1 Tax=Rossellomorea pakistanensis TaxID=992288 RepID=A0ABS2N7Q1_9BACI|nr:putative membrane protein SpoIIM required for sporulation [Bacillus pakistanensis]
MWEWTIIILLPVFLLVILEEGIYYLLNKSFSKSKKDKNSKVKVWIGFISNKLNIKKNSPTSS